jgi:outer membrane protein assembly factor BamB
MAPNGQRQRTGRVTPWVIAGLVAAFGLLTAYNLFYGARFQSNPDAMAALQKAALPDPQTPKALVGQWPQWRGPNGDGVSLEEGWQTVWPSGGPPRLWSNEAEGRYSCVAVARGRVYTILRKGNKEIVVCWDAEIGKTRWTFPYEADYNSGRHRVADFSQGPRSTPTVDGDNVYAVGATGLFHCLLARTGKLIWKRDLLPEFNAEPARWGVAFSPLIDGNLIFAVPGGANGNSVAALDKRTKKLQWKALDDPAAYSSPIAATIDGVRQTIFFTEKGLVGLAPKDGTVYWRFPWETSYGTNIATPIAVGNYVFISTGYGRGCALIEVKKGKDDQWQAQRVYEGSQMNNHYATSVRYGEHIYGFDETKLVCLNIRAGNVLWKEKGFGKGSLVIAGGQLVVLGERGNMAIAPASPDAFKPTATFRATHSTCWTMPVVAEGKLFVRDEDKVTCFDLRNKDR